MKKIINGRKYDTETAKVIGKMEYDDLDNPFGGWYCETLYVKKTGEFFLLGEGGERTAYSLNGDIVPITLDTAKAWSEAHLDADKYEEIFGEVAE